MRMGRLAELVLAADELDDLDAADVRHVQVEDDQGEVACSESRSMASRPLAACSKASASKGRRQARDHVAHDLAVVDNQQFSHLGFT